MSVADHQTRREQHRSDYLAGKSMFMDLIDEKSGKLVGTTGFREIEKIESDGMLFEILKQENSSNLAEKKFAEFGIILHPEIRGRGYGHYLFIKCLEYVQEKLNCQYVTAGTMIENEVMTKFLLKRGMNLYGQNGIWYKYYAKIDQVLENCQLISGAFSDRK